MNPDADIQAIQAIRGASVAFGSDGEKIGHVGDVYLDDATGQPSWVLIASGLFGVRSHFVPLDGMTVDGAVLTLGFTRAAVLAAPRVEEDEHLSAAEEAQLLAHYGVEHEAPAMVVPVEAGPAEALPEGKMDTIVKEALEAQEDDAQLARAHELTVEARLAAEKADPLGDGSYAGDAAKAPLIDTPDLEAAAHKKAAGTVGQPIARAVAPTAAVEPNSVWAPTPEEASFAGADAQPGTSEAADDEITAEDLEAQKKDEEQSLVREAHWLGADPGQLAGQDDDL